MEKLIVLHDSLLPRYRGFAPLVNALIQKEKRVGVTAVMGAKEYDRGNIVLQYAIEVHYPTRIEEEMRRMADLYAQITKELFLKLVNGTLDKFGNPQNEIEASYSLWRDDDDYRIDWKENAKNIEHFVSCVGYPYRGATAILNGELIKILKVEAVADVKIENRTPGKIIFITENLPVVVCGVGLLKLHDIRLINGESMLPLKQFRIKFQ